MLSCCYQGKVLDFHYKKGPLGFEYNFYIDDIFLGQIFRMRKNNWKAISFYKDVRGCQGGFGSRYHASEYLLVLTGFQKEN